jgi:hypothetical protein
VALQWQIVAKAVRELGVLSLVSAARVRQAPSPAVVRGMFGFAAVLVKEPCGLTVQVRPLRGGRAESLDPQALEEAHRALDGETAAALEEEEELLERPPTEALVVCLDVSGSMDEAADFDAGCDSDPEGNDESDKEDDAWHWNVCSDSESGSDYDKFHDADDLVVTGAAEMMALALDYEGSLSAEATVHLRAEAVAQRSAEDALVARLQAMTCFDDIQELAQLVSRFVFVALLFKCSCDSQIKLACTDQIGASVVLEEICELECPPEPNQLKRSRRFIEALLVSWRCDVASLITGVLIYFEMRDFV